MTTNKKTIYCIVYNANICIKFVLHSIMKLSMALTFLMNIRVKMCAKDNLTIIAKLSSLDLYNLARYL